MNFIGHNICVLALATSYAPDDCYFCGRPQADHRSSGRLCPDAVTPKQPRRRYQPIGWRDYATLGLEIGCYYRFRDDQYVWFDDLSLGETIETLLKEQPLMVSYQGAAFAAPLMWECYREGPDGATAHAFNSAAMASLSHAWVALWDTSYDLLEEILAAYPDTRLERESITLEQLALKTLAHRRLLNPLIFASLWQRGYRGQALTALGLDVWIVRALFARVCAGTALTMGNGHALSLPMPPDLQRYQ